jgi:hypothetical protein
MAGIKTALAVSAAAAAALVLAGCGSAPKSPAGSAPAASSSPAAARSPAASAAAASEQAFADGLATSASVVPASAVSGPVMTDYATFEQLFASALNASGNPNQAETVAPISGGYELCLSGSTCTSYTAFTTDSAGQVTGVSVNGQPVAGRLAAGPDSTMSGLTVSDVFAYRLTVEQNLVAVTFRIADTSYTPINTSPAEIATFVTSAGTLSTDDNYAVLMPATLAPGQVATGVAVFDTTGITGTFELRSNDGYSSLLASSVLQEVTG